MNPWLKQPSKSSVAIKKIIRCVIKQIYFVKIFLHKFAFIFSVAPKHAFFPTDAYPGIRGGSFFKNITFSSFKDCPNCGRGRAVALITNKGADDAIHPTQVEGFKFINVDEKSKVFFHR